MGVRDMSVVQNLQENIKYIRMSLLNLVKKKHAIRISSYFFTELAAFIISHISGRGSDKFGHTVFLHIFRHIDADHGLFASEHSFRKRFGKFCFSHAGRSEEKKRSDRASGIFKSHSAPLYCLRHCFHRLILSDYASVKFFFQMCQSL